MKLSKFTSFFTGLPRKIAENAFIGFLVLFLIALIFSGLLFYKYYFLVERAEVSQPEELIQLKEKTIEQVLQAWQTRERRFIQADSKQYPNPFKP
jgi:hypothetical protein